MSIEEPTTYIYLRTSTDKQTPENQLDDINKIAPQDTVVLTEQESAWKDIGREKFNILIDKIKKGKVKDLYVWDLDRLYRNRKKLIEFFELCKMFNCKVHSFRQQWFEDLNKIPAPFDEIMFNMMLQLIGWLAEDESSKKSQRVKMAIKKKQEGTFSYRGNKWGRKSIIDKVSSQIKSLRAEGKSYTQICQTVFYWDKDRNKKFVSKGLVHKILSEPLA